MKQYLDLCEHVLRHGVKSGNRTDVDSIRIFGHQMRFDLQKGFPLLTTKWMDWKKPFFEMLWFTKGLSNNIQPLLEENIHIWDQWALEDGSIGPMYGVQWRDWSFPQPVDPDQHSYVGLDRQITRRYSFPKIDQLQNLINGLKNDPYSRRHIVSSWNPAVLPVEKVDPRENVRHGRMSLAPCHWNFQAAVVPRDGVNQLSLMVTIRSNDLPLGAPYNIAQYAQLTHMLAATCGYEVGDLVYTIGDAHIYLNQIEGIELQLTREPRPLPKLEIKLPKHDCSIDDWAMDCFNIVDYDPHLVIKFPRAAY